MVERVVHPDHPPVPGLSHPHLCLLHPPRGHHIGVPANGEVFEKQRNRLGFVKREVDERLLLLVPVRGAGLPGEGGGAGGGGVDPRGGGLPGAVGLFRVGVGAELLAGEEEGGFVVEAPPWGEQGGGAGGEVVDRGVGGGGGGGGGGNRGRGEEKGGTTEIHGGGGGERGEGDDVRMGDLLL